MGNRGLPFKRLPEETSPPLKAGFSHSHPTSVEMEPLQQMNESNKWHKTSTRFCTPTKRWICRRFKPWFTVFASCLIVLAITALIALTAFKVTKTPFASKKDVLELYLLMNKSLDNVIQQLNDQKCCNNGLHLQDQVSAIQEQLRSMQSINVTLSSEIDAIQRNLSDLSEVVHTLQKQVDSLPRKDSLNHDRNVTELTEKVSRLEGFAANLSSAQQELESDVNLFHTNLSNLVVHLQSDISNISDTQDRFSVKITSLQHNISQLGSQLNAISSSIQQGLPTTAQGDSSLSNRLSQLEHQLTAVSNQMHTPVNLYENCREETVSCSIDPDGSHTDYWRDCPTKYLPLHKQVYYILVLMHSTLHLARFIFKLGMVHYKLPV